MQYHYQLSILHLQSSVLIVKKLKIPVRETQEPKNPLSMTLNGEIYLETHTLLERALDLMKFALQGITPLCFIRN